jgi:hypothetical protein
MLLRVRTCRRVGAIYIDMYTYSANAIHQRPASGFCRYGIRVDVIMLYSIYT